MAVGVFIGHLFIQEDFKQPFLLMGGAVFRLCWLFGLRRPSTGAYRLLGGPGLDKKMAAS